MSKGHIYFEIQADDTSARAQFLLPNLWLEIFRGQRRPHSLLDDRDRRLARWFAAASGQDSSAAIGHERVCLLARS